MRDTFSFSLREGFGRGFESAWDRFVINCFPARPRRARGQCEVAKRDPLEMPELTILPQRSAQKGQVDEVHT